MRRRTVLLLLPLLFACKGPSFVQKGVHQGIDVSYRWNHPTGKPSEVLLKMTNTSTQDKQVSLELDLYYQGRTIETFQVDTCIRGGQTLNGKMNGVYFVPTRLTQEQSRSDDTQVELTKVNTSELFACP